MNNTDSPVMTGMAKIDLPDLELGDGPWPCTVLLDLVGRPDRLDIRFPMDRDVILDRRLTPEAPHGQICVVTFADGTTLEANVQLFSGWLGDWMKDGEMCDEMAGRFELGGSIWRGDPSIKTELWRFKLTNVRLHRADHVTEKVTEHGTGYVRKVVRFHVAGRDWTLVDDFADKWKAINKGDMAHPLLTARLETPYRDGDMREDLEDLATDIEALLRFGLSRAVTWISSARVAAEDVMEECHRNRWTSPFGISRSPINDGFEPGQLKMFIETTYPNYSADRDWFHRSLLLYLISQIGSHLEIRMALHNTLLDRISDKILGKDEGKEIDDDLSGRIDKDFKKRLHTLLSELSPMWTKEHSRRLVGAISNWNENPSFPGGVERAAERLDIWPLEKRQLAKRHKLIHRGVYDDGDGTSVYDYWKAIECMVVMMLLRMLGYSGPFYHVAFGHHAVILKDYLRAGTMRPPYPVQTVPDEK